ncbi:MAG: fibronectin type III domain-containing protein, partial [Candidatus Colwellbacteria bacterium]|nr:fibronectin type III domain-containing protein [Candidatus Colwellbacteria bacterium]
MKGVIKKLFAGAVLMVGLLILGNSAFAAETPEAAATGASSISSTSATLKASINPGGASTEYKLEYGTSTSFGYSTVWHTSGSGSYVNYETETINGLSSGTTYYYRVIARNSVGTVTSSYVSFVTTGTSSGTDTTGDSPEAAATGASSISSSSASLGGLVDANGLSTRYWMEYGPTTSLG